MFSMYWLIIFSVKRRVICQAVFLIYYTNISVYINKCYSLLLLLLLKIKATSEIVLNFDMPYLISNCTK